jgi:putative colanic acid biosynthesis UDP-glucose lipid carrier transferase
MGVKVIGFFDDRMVAPTRVAEGVSTDGTFDELISRVRAGEIDSVYITLPLRAELRVRHIVERLRDSTATVLYVPDFSAFGLLGARWEVVDGVTLVSLIDTPHQGASAMLKRLFDIAVASASLAVVALPMLLIACAIKLTSAGPVVFRQKRYGLDGRPFEIWKFRTMVTVEDGEARFQQARRNDARVTRVGSLLRRTSLDELPQLINVLQGRMSIVGPRPHPVALNETHRKLIEGYMLRHKVKPGITGWAQINGFRGETDTPEKMRGRIERDLEYIDRWSLMLDIRIILLTLRRAWADSNAY